MILDYNLNLVLKDDYILYFKASWNSSCNLHIEALKELDLVAKINIYVVNVTKYPHLKAKYKVNRIPTYILFKNDDIISRIDGSINRYSLIKWYKDNRV